MAYLLGIDIGTSGVKAVVIDRDGTIAAQGTAALTVQRPHPLWSEQDPDAWWQATDAAVRAIPADVRRAVLLSRAVQALAAVACCAVMAAAGRSGR